MFIVVSYDIVDDKTRNKIAKTLLDYGTRVQYSVFECVLTKEQLHRLEQELTELYDPEVNPWDWTVS
ncbi:MAG: CRISPR-associated endonuclease Cas2 [Candidatus Latescibacterota bacterium]|nr:MAG: CRISPR-associated endonuclease Cas2 [Candidatus Latescibacterota bacterium]